MLNSFHLCVCVSTRLKMMKHFHGLQIRNFQQIVLLDCTEYMCTLLRVRTYCKRAPFVQNKNNTHGGAPTHTQQQQQQKNATQI